MASWRATSVLPTPVGPENRKLPIGLSGSRRPARLSFIAVDSTSIALSWPNTTRFRSRSRCSSACGRRDDRLGRDARHGRDHRLDLRGGDGFLALRRRHQHLHRADFVDHVDRLVGQLAVVDVARRKLDRGLDRVGRVLDLVVVLEGRAQALEDLDRVLDRRLVDVDLLEPAQQRAVLFEVVAEFLVGGRADAADRAADSAGLSRLDASIAPPLVAPAPITVWISSMNRIASGIFSSSVTTCFSRSSKSPR